jgi:hypothetical protein
MILYICLRFSFGIFTPYNYLTASADIKKGNIQIIEYGEMKLNFDKEQQLATSYGFSFKPIGCVVSSDVINGIKYYNRKMISHLDSKYGQGWWNVFEKQIDSIDSMRLKEQITSNVLSLVENQSSVKDIIKQVDSLSKGQRHIVLIPLLYDTAKNIYLVKVAEDNGIEVVSYFNFFVDPDSMKIISEPIR